MKFGSQFLEEKFKNKDSIKELENIIENLSSLSIEEIELDPNHNPIFNTTENKNSLTFRYKGKRIEIEKQQNSFSGEISDEKNKIGIPNDIAKIIFKKFETLLSEGEILIHNDGNPN